MNVTKSATILLSVALLVAIHPIMGQESDGARPQASGDSELDKRQALVVATLAEYGEDNRDPMALLAAASILKRMEAGVARRDGSHQTDAEDHGDTGLFTVDGLLEGAKNAAANLDERTARHVLGMVETLGQGERNYLGYLHTHWVWWCGAPYFPPGHCEYRWVSHY